MLKADHQKVQKLFEQFEAAEEQSEKDQIIEEAITELKVHASLEEEVLYPAVRGQIEEEDLINEAEVDHHVAKLRIAELQEPTDDDDRRNSRFKVLSETVKHHIEEDFRLWKGRQSYRTPAGDLARQKFHSRIQQSDMVGSRGMRRTETKLVSASLPPLRIRFSTVELTG
jgi:hypothetical protein